MRLRALTVVAMMAAAPSFAGEVSAICFTPGDDCAGLVVTEIERARRQVLVQAYSFTSRDIAQALVAARRRGVDVRVVLDKGQTGERYSGATFLANAGIPVLIDGAHAAAHNKVIVIDGARVITGSFNLTFAAQEKNAENVVVLTGADVAPRFAANFETHALHSSPYKR